MQLLFICIALGGLCYFLLVRRQFDLLALGFLSGCAYFFPGFVGEVIYPLEASSVYGIHLEIDPSTYLVMVLVLGSILGVALLSSRMGLEARVLMVQAAAQTQRETPQKLSFMPEVATFWAVFGLAMTWQTAGGDILFSPDKNLILEEFTRWSVLWSIGSVVGLLMAVEQRRLLLALVCAGLIGVEMYVGFRVSLATALIGLIYISLNRLGEVRALIAKFHVFALGALGMGALLVYKYLYIAIKFGDFDYVWANLANPELYHAALFRSEPFLTQAILNQVLIEEYRVGWAHLDNLFASLMIFSSELGLEVQGFNDLVQPHLFGSITQSGIAANIWAEAYSVAGWFTLIPFALLYALTLLIGTRIIARAPLDARAFLIAGFCFWAFYIHRNDMLFQITLEKRVAFYFVLCWLSNQAVLAVMRKREAGAGTLSRISN
jgi:hypothetical protein